MKVDAVDASVDGAEVGARGVFPQVSGGVVDEVDAVDGEKRNYAHTGVRAHAHTPARDHIAFSPSTRQPRQPPVNPSTPVVGGRPAPTRPANAPRVRGGVAVMDGVRHEMKLAQPGRPARDSYGLNANHHVRVWCTCMDNPTNEPGFWGSVDPNDPRRLGAWDWLGVADVRESGSAMAIFKAHLQEEADRAATATL